MEEARDAGSPKIPDVSKEEIHVAAWMVWQMIQREDSFKRGAQRRKHQHRPGYAWEGSVNDVINRLWPDLKDRYLVTREESNDVKRALNRYLYQSGMLICLQNRGVTLPSTWWVSEKWNPVTVSYVRDLPVTDDFAEADPGQVEEVVSDTETTSDVGQDVSPIPEFEDALAEDEEQPLQNVEDTGSEDKQVDEGESGEYLCRDDGCSQSFGGAHHRAMHERTHGFRYNADGTVTRFTPGQGRSDDNVVKAALIRASREHGDWLNVETLTEMARSTNPMISKPSCYRAIKQLLVTPWRGWGMELAQHKAARESGKTVTLRRYRAVQFTPTPADVAKLKAVDVPSIEEQNEQSVRQTTTDLLVDFVALLNDEVALDELKRRVSGGGSQDVKHQLDQAIARIEDLERALSAVIEERDMLQRRFNMLREVFGINPES